jgi:hypothetical protein
MLDQQLRPSHCSLLDGKLLLYKEEVIFSAEGKNGPQFASVTSILIFLGDLSECINTIERSQIKT